MEMKNPPPEAPVDNKRLQIPAPGRTAWIGLLGLLLVLALVSTVAALFQAPGRNPAEHPEFPSLDWFIQPIEQDYAYQQCPQTEDYSCRMLEMRAAEYWARLRPPTRWRC